MGSRVILADDSVTIQKVVGIIFANEGYDLTVVASGDAAIAKAKEVKPDVMLVDALMPGKNGYEVCREIRQDPALAHTAILLMTGAFEVVDEEKNRQSGADEFIIKPFESQTLIDATNRLIALTAARLANPAPVAAPPVAPPPLQAAVAEPLHVAPPVDDIWATGFDDEPAAAPEATGVFAAAAPVSAPVAPQPVKTTSDEDIWGAFEMDEIESAPAAAVVAPATRAAADDIFSFESATPAVAAAPVEDEFVLEEIAFDEPIPQAPPTSTGFEPVGEQELSFGDVQSFPVSQQSSPDLPSADDFGAIAFDAQVAPPLAPASDDFGTISFDEPAAPLATPVMPSAEDFGSLSFDEPKAPVAVPLPVTPEIPPAPVFVEPPQPPPVAVPVAAPAAAPIVTAAGSLDEEQLKALLSTISREVIERIVWEVVPDLAEMIIREEIRKLKAGMA